MGTTNKNELAKIYSALADETSKNIYANRLLYSLLGRKEAMTKIIYDYNSCNASFLRSEKCVFYGGGGGVNWLVRTNSNLHFIVDKYKTGVVEGIPIISLETFLQLPNAKDYLLLLTQGEALLPKVEAELDALGLRHLSVYRNILPLLNRVQYFDLPQLALEEQEWFADVGAFDGGTSKQFFRHSKKGHAYVFEPDPVHFATVTQNLCEYKNVEIFPYGAYEQNTTMLFDPDPVEGDPSAARLSNAGSVAVEVRKLDDLLKGKKVTFIKMDIEGAELAALRGAEQIIRRQKPRLAICVYHKPEDMWEIPSLILSYNPDYKLYLRHYSIAETETVLYAI